MSEVNAEVRQQLVDAIVGRYRASTPAEKSHILDEFVALTGDHRTSRRRRGQRPSGSERYGLTTGTVEMPPHGHQRMVITRVWISRTDREIPTSPQCTINDETQ